MLGRFWCYWGGLRFALAVVIGVRKSREPIAYDAFDLALPTNVFSSSVLELYTGLEPIQLNPVVCLFPRWADKVPQIVHAY